MCDYWLSINNLTWNCDSEGNIRSAILWSFLTQRRLFTFTLKKNDGEMSCRERVYRTSFLLRWTYFIKDSVSSAISVLCYLWEVQHPEFHLSLLHPTSSWFFSTAVSALLMDTSLSNCTQLSTSFDHTSFLTFASQLMLLMLNFSPNTFVHCHTSTLQEIWNCEVVFGHEKAHIGWFWLITLYIQSF